MKQLQQTTGHIKAMKNSSISYEHLFQPHIPHIEDLKNRKPTLEELQAQASRTLELLKNAKYPEVIGIKITEVVTKNRFLIPKYIHLHETIPGWKIGSLDVWNREDLNHPGVYLLLDGRIARETNEQDSIGVPEIISDEVAKVAIDGFLAIQKKLA